MNLLALFLPMCVLSSTFLFFLLDARPESTFPTYSGPVSLAKREPISLFSAKMEAQSPGMSAMRILYFFFQIMPFVS